MEALIVIAFLALFIGFPIYAYVNFRKGEVLRFETLASPDEVMMTVVGQIGTGRGWATVTQSPTNVAMTYVRQPNILIAAILFVTCVGIMPAVIYWWLMSKKETLNVMIGNTPTGNTRLQVTSNGWKGKRSGQALRDAVGLAPGAVVTAVENDAPAVPGAAPQAQPAIGAPVASLAPTAPAPPAEAAAATPAGWYDDPEDETQLRYFDGSGWTEHRSPKS